jgi:hypothetical protein
MYQLTVRDAKDDNVLLTRIIYEPPNKEMFDQLGKEIGCSCYVDVCRIAMEDEDGTDAMLAFEESVEFELVRPDDYEEFEDLEDE